MRNHRHRKLSKKQIRLTITIFVIVLLAVLRVWESNSIETTKIVYSDPKIPAAFDGMKIVQVSDLHNKKFGAQQKRLLDRVEDASPDVIFITGDLIDRRTTNMEVAMDFIRGATEMAPVYYVSGNHEAWSGIYPEICTQLESLGVIIIDDTSTELIRDGESARIIGLADPDFYTTNYLEGTNSVHLEETLNQLSDRSSFQILLSHRPELIDLYAQAGVDLVFSGHAHGGQIRVPFIGAIIAPDQGLFPKYTDGAYMLDETTMVVSRGLGNSVIPIRTFNRPEVIVVTLVADDKNQRDYIPYGKIPGSYSIDDAIADNYVVFDDLDIVAGQSVWDDFLEKTQNGESSMVRLAFNYTLGDPDRYSPELFELIKDDYPLLYVQDLSFDGEKYTLFYTENDKVYSFEYEYLKRFEGEPQSNTAMYSEYVVYALVNDDTVTWEEIEKGKLSSQFGAYIDHQIVYSDYIY